MALGPFRGFYGGQEEKNRVSGGVVFPGSRARGEFDRCHRTGARARGGFVGGDLVVWAGASSTRRGEYVAGGLRWAGNRRAEAK